MTAAKATELSTPNDPFAALSPKEALAVAVDLAGGQEKMAAKLTEFMQKQAESMGLPLPKPVLQQHVWNWLFRNKGPLPGEFAIPIECVIDKKITRYQLRPDLYPLEQVA